MRMSQANAKLAPCGLQGASLADRALLSKTVLSSALVEFADGFGDSSQPCLGGPRSFDREYNPLLVTVGQPVKEAFGVCIAVKRFPQVRRHIHLASLGVGFDLDLHLIADLDTAPCAMFSADGKPELTCHRRHRTAVGVTVDRDTDWWALARFEGLGDLWRNDDACSSLAVKLYSGTKSHSASPSPQLHQAVKNSTRTGARACGSTLCG
jgi:hypothetical protein